MYLLQLFRCKKNNEITKSGSISLFGKLDPSGAPKPTLGPKTPLKGPGRAKIGVNAPHVVQLTGFGPKKRNLNRSVPRCVPFTRNQPITGTSSSGHLSLFNCRSVLQLSLLKHLIKPSLSNTWKRVSRVSQIRNN